MDNLSEGGSKKPWLIVVAVLVVAAIIGGVVMLAPDEGGQGFLRRAPIQTKPITDVSPLPHITEQISPGIALMTPQVKPTQQQGGDEGEEEFELIQPEIMPLDTTYLEAEALQAQSVENVQNTLNMLADLENEKLIEDLLIVMKLYEQENEMYQEYLKIQEEYNKINNEKNALKMLWDRLQDAFFLFKTYKSGAYLPVPFCFYLGDSPIAEDGSTIPKCWLINKVWAEQIWYPWKGKYFEELLTLFKEYNDAIVKANEKYSELLLAAEELQNFRMNIENNYPLNELNMVYNDYRHNNISTSPTPTPLYYYQGAIFIRSQLEEALIPINDYKSKLIAEEKWLELALDAVDYLEGEIKSIEEKYSDYNLNWGTIVYMDTAIEAMKLNPDNIATRPGPDALVKLKALIQSSESYISNLNFLLSANDSFTSVRDYESFLEKQKEYFQTAKELRESFEQAILQKKGAELLEAINSKASEVIVGGFDTEQVIVEGIDMNASGEEFSAQLEAMLNLAISQAQESAEKGERSECGDGGLDRNEECDDGMDDNCQRCECVEGFVARGDGTCVEEEADDSMEKSDAMKFSNTDDEEGPSVNGPGVSSGNLQGPAPLTIGGCGNNVINVGEDCDGNDLGGETCQTLGYDTGSLKCGEDCRFDEKMCSNLTVLGSGSDDESEELVDDPFSEESSGRN